MEYKPHKSLDWRNPDWVLSPRCSPPTSPLAYDEVPWMVFEDEVVLRHASSIEENVAVRPEAEILGALQTEILTEIADTRMHEEECTSTNPAAIQQEASTPPLWAEPLRTWTRRMKAKAQTGAEGNPTKKAKKATKPTPAAAAMTDQAPTENT